ncbi:MAG: endo alpha-1,4 polygalactosaminidase [bacterium]
MKFRSAEYFFIAIFFAFTMRCADNTDESRDFRQDMRTFVQGISTYAKSVTSGFLVIAQNGQELITENGEAGGSIAQDYSNALDGIGREDLFYGYQADDIPTPETERNYMLGYLDLAENNNVDVLVIDYCSTQIYIDSSYEMSEAREFVAFAANHRQLDNIPHYPAEPYNTNNADVATLSDGENFLYLINTERYASKADLLNSLQDTDYDVLIIDLFYAGDELLDAQDIASLKHKENGGLRLVLAYCSIGEAEDYRYYWRSEWDSNPPDWLEQENPNWPGNFLVKYWEDEWQDIIYGNEDSYVKKIIDAGFSGIYLDIIDAFEYFENE